MLRLYKMLRTKKMGFARSNFTDLSARLIDTRRAAPNSHKKLSYSQGTHSLDSRA
jgi:hypothetical protein